MQKSNDVIALGNALMDFLVEVDEEKFLEFNVTKGQFTLVDENQAKEILRKLKEDNLTIEIVPGGDSPNMLRAMGLLGANVILVGKVGNDQHGEMFVQEMKDHGVISKISSNDSITGHALTFVTPDTERSFSVHLGASIEIEKEDVLEADIAKSKILHISAYQLEGKTKDIVFHAMDLAKKHDTLISIDLADSGLINRNRELVEKVLREYVHIVFVNETEAQTLTTYTNDLAAKELGKMCQIAVVKVGAEGSYIFHVERTEHVKAFDANPVDTTGAGDTYAAGFLYGFCQGWNIQKSAKLGSLLAARVIEKKGVKFDKEEVLKVKEEITSS